VEKIISLFCEHFGVSILNEFRAVTFQYFFQTVFQTILQSRTKMTINFENYKACRNGRCCRCGKRHAITRDGLFCRKCLRKIIRKLTPDLKTYIGSENLDRKEWNQDRFDRSGIIDFDAEYSLGGKPDYDAWFPTEEEHYEKFMHIIYKF
jgi:ribosomal protein S14